MSTPFVPNESVQSSELSQQIVLVLVGLVASGKSTFAKALEEHNSRFRRCNQDDLGNRRAVEDLARHSLRQGFSVCIDRTNIDQVQRAHWVNIAKEFPGTEAWCLVFDTPRHVCASRLQMRTDHPTITSPEMGLRVLHGFANDFRVPSANEGFNRIYYLKPVEHTSPSYTAEDINVIMKRVGDSGEPAGSGQRHPSAQLGRQQDLMASFVTRGGSGEWRPSRRRGFFGRGGRIGGRGRSHPYQGHGSDRHDHEWFHAAPAGLQSPQHEWSSSRIRHSGGRATEANIEHSPSPSSSSPSARGTGSADSPFIPS